MSSIFFGHSKVQLLTTIAVVGFAFLLDIFHPTISSAQAQRGLRIDVQVTYRGNPYGNSGYLSPLPNGSIRYEINNSGHSGGKVTTGDSKTIANAVTLQNKGGVNVGVKVDDGSSNVLLGNIILTPNSRGVGFEAVAALQPPLDFYLKAASLFQDFLWTESDGTVSQGLDMSTLKFKIWLLRTSGGFGGLLQIGDQIIDLELPSVYGCEKLKELIEKLKSENLPFSAEQLENWYKIVC